MQRLHRETFLQRLRECFPEIVATFSDIDKGLLHCEMATVRRATQAAIDAGDRDLVRRHFLFIDEVLRDAGPDVENAVIVSYLEGLAFTTRRSKAVRARELLTPRLEHELAAQEAYLERLFAKTAETDASKTRRATAARPGRRGLAKPGRPRRLG